MGVVIGSAETLEVMVISSFWEVGRGVSRIRERENMRFEFTS